MTPTQSAQLGAVFENSAEARRMLAVVLGAMAPGNANESHLYVALDKIAVLEAKVDALTVALAAKV